MTTKAILFADLRSTIHAHQSEVSATFQSLDDHALSWRPTPKEWSILICFDHLNQTYLYYLPKINRALASPVARGPERGPDTDSYRASFWGRFYLSFALNPRFSFPTPGAFMPNLAPQRAVLETYLANQQKLLELLGRLQEVDLTRTPIPIEMGVRFNLGDCLKVLVYHDSLHISQAHRVLEQSGQHSMAYTSH